ncbi:hypothetical protein ACHAXM_010746 [Skeletonema potamos]|jgi:hypothetical protein
MALNTLLTISLLCITCTVLRILPAAAFSSISSQTTRSVHKASKGLMVSADVEEDTTTTIADIEEITTFASKNGVELKFTTNLARGYRGVAVAKNDPENILGYIEGFIRPAGKVLHADKMEIFKSALYSARRENAEFTGGGTFLGPGLLIAFVCLLHGVENGCQKIEFLAIDDAEFQHKRLVRYYKTAGFEEVRYVGEELKDIPDRLVWGGCGTLMTNDIDKVLRKWTRLIRSANRRMES